MIVLPISLIWRQVQKCHRYPGTDWPFDRQWRQHTGGGHHFSGQNGLQWHHDHRQPEEESEVQGQSGPWGGLPGAGSCQGHAGGGGSSKSVVSQPPSLHPGPKTMNYFIKTLKFFIAKFWDINQYLFLI